MYRRRENQLMVVRRTRDSCSCLRRIFETWREPNGISAGPEVVFDFWHLQHLDSCVA